MTLLRCPNIACERSLAPGQYVCGCGTAYLADVEDGIREDATRMALSCAPVVRDRVRESVLTGVGFGLCVLGVAAAVWR